LKDDSLFGAEAGADWLGFGVTVLSDWLLAAVVPEHALSAIATDVHASTTKAFFI
jgi:hypothetical protein